MVKLDDDLTVNARINNDRYNFRSDIKVAIPKHIDLQWLQKVPLYYLLNYLINYHSHIGKLKVQNFFLTKLKYFLLRIASIR